MNAQFFSFSKRKNSTKVPSVSDAAFSLTININDPNSSILTPVIRVTPPAARNSAPHNIWDCNYVYIPSFSRYYYISNWEYNSDGTWSGICDVDVLASWKGAILASGGYIGRSAAHYDPLILDTFYPAKDLSITLFTQNATGFSALPQNGTYILGIVSTGSTPGQPDIGGVKYYIMTSQEVATMVNHMCQVTDPDWTGTDAIMSNLFKQAVNPLQYVVSCKWFPFQINTYGLQSVSVYLSGWDTTSTGIPLNSTVYLYPETTTGSEYSAIPIPHTLPATLPTNFPDSTVQVTDQNYPVYPPYADYEIITPWGTYELDAYEIAMHLLNANTGDAYLYYKMEINLIDGSAIMKFALKNQSEIYVELFRQTIALAIDVPLFQEMRNETNLISRGQDYVGYAESAFNGLLGIVGNPFGGTHGVASSLMSLGTSIADGRYDNWRTSVNSSQGTQSSFVPSIAWIWFKVKRRRTLEQDKEIYGRPLKIKTNMIGSQFPGFLQMDYSNFTGPCTDTERDSVVAFLEGGIYIE